MSGDRADENKGDDAMRVFNQGAFVRVTMSAREVDDWADRWPCSGLCGAGVSATFSAENGDVVDHNFAENHPFADDGACLALLEDMQNHAAARLNLPDMAR